MPPRLRTWLQLLRAPNLLTVPGDAIAGFILANNGILSGALPAVVLASLCFYGAGLLMNDIVDYHEDLRERPSRPLPSGAARIGTVRLVCWALNLAGVLLLFVASVNAVRFPEGMGARGVASWQANLPIAGAALIAAVCLYNRFTKRIPIIGALNMGLCRGLNVLLGALTGPFALHEFAVGPAIFLAAYIAAVTNLARHETHAAVPVLARIWPAVLAMTGCVLIVIDCRGSLFYRNIVAAIAIFGTANIAAVLLAMRLFNNPPPPLPSAIGAQIRLLLLFQAGFCLLVNWHTAWICGGALLLLWPISRAVSRRFYAS